MLNIFAHTLTYISVRHQTNAKGIIKARGQIWSWCKQLCRHCCCIADWLTLTEKQAIGSSQTQQKGKRSYRLTSGLSENTVGASVTYAPCPYPWSALRCAHFACAVTWPYAPSMAAIWHRQYLSLQERGRCLKGNADKSFSQRNNSERSFCSAQKWLFLPALWFVFNFLQQLSKWEDCWLNPDLRAAPQVP